MDSLECNRGRGAAALCMGRDSTTSRIALGSRTVFGSDIVFLTAMKTSAAKDQLPDGPERNTSAVFEFVSCQYSPKVNLQTDHY
jgi:hypothetical protein